MEELEGEIQIIRDDSRAASDQDSKHLVMRVSEPLKGKSMLDVRSHA